MTKGDVKSENRSNGEITIFEAGMMWELLTIHYDFLEGVFVLLNYVKDKDLHGMLHKTVKQADGRIKQLEEMMSKHKVTLPPRPPAQVTVTEIPASMSDGYIFRRAYNSIVRFLPDHFVAYKYSNSRPVRGLFKQFLLDEMEQFEELQDFGLKKNWLQLPPDYLGKNAAETKVNLTSMEAAQLWYRLNTRYDTLEFTNFMVNLAGDIDLKTVVVQGQTMLRKQIALLERMAVEYGIPLPAKPPEEESVGKPLDATTNAYVYRQVLRGMQAYFLVHIVAFQHSTTPAVRQELKKLLQREIEVYDKFVAYGQIRGWVLEQPAYRN